MKARKLDPLQKRIGDFSPAAVENSLPTVADMVYGDRPPLRHFSHAGRTTSALAVQYTPLRFLWTYLRPFSRWRLLLPSQDPAPMPYYARSHRLAV